MRRLVLTAVVPLLATITILSAGAVAPAAASSVGLLQVDATRTGHAELAWTQVAGATSYTVLRDSNPVMSGLTLRWDDTSVAFGATYTYAVTADLGGSTADVGSRTVTIPTRADTGPPTPVTGLAVTSKSDTTVGLSWNDSTDDVGVVAYMVFSGSVRMAFAEGSTSVSVKNLKSMTAYTFVVKALDAEGNFSSPTTINVTTTLALDTTAPSKPSGVKATPYSPGRIDVTWGASTDSHSMGGYLIYRTDQSNPIADLPVALARVYSDTNVVPGVTYGYRVKAYDSAGNVSAQSSLRSAAPLGAGVVQIVRGPLVQQVDQSSARITWQTSIAAPSELQYTAGGTTTSVTDPVARTNHAVLIDGLLAGASISYTISYPTSTKTGSFRTCGAVGDASKFALVGDFGGGGTPEKDIATHIAAYGSDAIISVGDNVYPAGEDVDFPAKFFTPYASAFAGASFWTAFGNHEVYDPGAAATHANLTQPGNESVFSFDCSSVHVLVLNTEIPFGPGSPQYAFAQTDLASATAPWRIVVMHRPPYSSSTLPSFGAIDVRNALTPLFEQFGVQLVVTGHSHNYERTSAINGVTYLVTGGGGNGLNTFPPDPQPSWSAFHAAEYEYVQMAVTSNQISLVAHRQNDTILDQATLNRGSDVTAPSTPTGLQVTGTSASTISLAWDPASDDTAVTNYRIFRNGSYLTQIGNQTAFTDTGLTAGGIYRYAVRAVDAAKNTSGASDPVTATTGTDTSAPSVPANLRVVYNAPGHVEFAWDASSDNIGVAGYGVFRDGVSYGSTTQLNFVDTAPLAGETHGYQVRAYDAVPNTSGLSSPLSITVPASGSLLFSDDFESGSLGLWTSVTGLTVSQGVPAPSGGLWVARETSASAGATYAYKVISPTMTEVYAKFRFKVLSRTGSVDLMRFRSTAGGSKESVYVSNTTNTLATRNAAGTSTRSSGPTIVTGQWYTVELHSKVATPSVTEVWLDGVHLTELDATGDISSSSIGQFLLGHTGTGTYDVVFDDVAVSKNFI